jgi:hypothetical protein
MVHLSELYGRAHTDLDNATLLMLQAGGSIKNVVGELQVLRSCVCRNRRERLANVLIKLGGEMHDVPSS